MEPGQYQIRVANQVRTGASVTAIGKTIAHASIVEN